MITKILTLEIDALREKEERIGQEVQKLREKQEDCERGIENNESMVLAKKLSRELVEVYIEVIYIEEMGETDIIWKK